jgi:hypothetical protein
MRKVGDAQEYRPGRARARRGLQTQPDSYDALDRTFLRLKLRRSERSGTGRSVPNLTDPLCRGLAILVGDWRRSHFLRSAQREPDERAAQRCHGRTVPDVGVCGRRADPFGPAPSVAGRCGCGRVRERRRLTTACSWRCFRCMRRCAIQLAPRARLHLGDNCIRRGCARAAHKSAQCGKKDAAAQAPTAYAAASCPSWARAEGYLLG